MTAANVCQSCHNNKGFLITANNKLYPAVVKMMKAINSHRSFHIQCLAAVMFCSV